MKHPVHWFVLGSAVILAAALLAPAQHRHGSGSTRGAGRSRGSAVQPRGRPTGPTQNTGRIVSRARPGRRPRPTHRFIPGFGLTPVVRERFPVFGLGFDAHHFHALNRRRGFGFRFASGKFRGRSFFGTGFFPIFSSTVVVVPQVIEVPVPVVLLGADLASPGKEESATRDDFPAAAGLPFNWNERLRVAEPGLRPEQPPLPQLTLLVLKDGSIFAATDYWLEEGRLLFLSSTGAQSSVGLAELDWPMTNRLNAERGVRVVLRSLPR